VVSITVDGEKALYKAASECFGGIPCVAHRLHNVIKSTVKKSSLEGTVQRMKKIINWFLKSPKAHFSLVRGNAAQGTSSSPSLVRWSPTRWIGLEVVLKRFLSNKTKIENFHYEGFTGNREVKNFCK